MIQKNDPIVVAIALSLYAYNVSPYDRAIKLYDYFRGDCMELDELIERLNGPYAATELPYPTAKVYVQHAMEMYGEEAFERAQINDTFINATTR